jgi:hypothetical protein
MSHGGKRCRSEFMSGSTAVEELEKAAGELDLGEVRERGR